MTAYRVVLLDCDICGAVYDPGIYGIRTTFARVRALARRGSHEGGWRSWRDVDVCPNHDDLTMPQALDAVDARRGGRS